MVSWNSEGKAGGGGGGGGGWGGVGVGVGVGVGLGLGGVFELEIRRHGGILTIRILNEWGPFRSGISTRDRQECVP